MISGTKDTCFLETSDIPLLIENITIMWSEKDCLLDIFTNLGFKVYTEKILGEIVEISPLEGFLFSSITGAEYMINETGVTMKGRSEVFIHRSVFQEGAYIYTPGLFNRDINGNLLEGNSSFHLLKKYPAVFSGHKYILIETIPTGRSSSIEKVIHNKIKTSSISPENIILFKNFESGASLEPLLEYFACKLFISKGYLVENQVPWFQQSFSMAGNRTGIKLTGGIPDFSAFHSFISNVLSRVGLIGNEGILLNVLPVARNFGLFSRTTPSKTVVNYKYELIIGEVKSSKNGLDQAINQLRKYSSVGLADSLYTIIPDVLDNGIPEFGEIYLDANRININIPKRTVLGNNAFKREDSEWIDNYIKFLLLGNLQFNKIVEMIEIHRKKHFLPKLNHYQSRHLIDMVINTDPMDILNNI